MRRAPVIVCLVLVLSLSVDASAHHAMEYIEIESVTTSRRGDFVFHLHYDYYVDDETNPNLDHWELTPGLTYGITNRLMFDVHTHFAKFGIDHVVDEERPEYEPLGPSPFMEAVATALQWRLTEGWVVDFAVVGAFEVPLSRSKKLLGSEDNVYEANLIAASDFGEHSNVTLNLWYETEGDEDGTFWALAAKTPIGGDPNGIAAGLEILGSFEETSDNLTFLPGIYGPLGAQNIIFKTGLEFGKVDGANAMRASLTLMYKF